VECLARLGPTLEKRERRLKFDLGDHLSEERVESDPVHQDSSIETYVSLQNQTPVKNCCVLVFFDLQFVFNLPP
jgi:hypothetical protein